MAELNTERIQPFLRWRDAIANTDFELLAQSAFQKNNWFTPENTLKALKGVLHFFERIEEFAQSYPASKTQKKVGLIMAGNVPLVGFQDALLVLLAGHRLVAKLSAQDDYLPKALLSLYPLEDFEFAERLNGCDAYIATGSDNTARYFEYYFAKFPHIIRKNRTSVAILDGNETETELKALADDILDYFGLGCRSVSSVWIPENYPIPRLLDALNPKAQICSQNHKYANNYEYQRACLLLGNIAHIDGSGILLRESQSLSSAVSVLHYRLYKSEDQVKQWLLESQNQIQCVIGKGFLPFGTAQKPDIFFCADQIDTMKFLVELG
jgi:hypothetical protein